MTSTAENLIEMPICFKRVFQDHVEQRREVCSLFHRFPAGWHWERLCILLLGSEAHFFFAKQQALKDLSGMLGTRTRRRIFAQGGNVVCQGDVGQYLPNSTAAGSRIRNACHMDMFFSPACTILLSCCAKGRMDGCMYRVPRHLRRYIQVVCGYICK
jgi:hypothetical protein